MNINKLKNMYKNLTKKVDFFKTLIVNYGVALHRTCYTIDCIVPLCPAVYKTSTFLCVIALPLSLRVAKSALDFLGVNFWSRDFFGFARSPRDFLGS